LINLNLYLVLAHSDITSFAYVKFVEGAKSAVKLRTF